MDNNAPVVVGVDGSDTALAAVRMAVRQAVMRRRPLRVVHAFIWPLMRVPLGPVEGGPPEGGLRNQAERVVADAVAEACRVDPDIPVTGVVVEGAPTPVLLAESRQAALLVLASRGLGGFAGLLVGSSAVQVSMHAECPVLIARGEPRTDGPVVVGVDDSELSRQAVEFAVAEAARRDVPLVALRAWLHPTPLGPGDILPLVYDLDALADEEERMLAEAVAGCAEQYPQVDIQRRLVRGSPAKALVEASETAQLVVVGARGRGGLAGLLLGSVSHSVLHHSRCPVAIVRAARAAGRS